MCITGILGRRESFGYVKSLIYNSKIGRLGMVSFINTIIMDVVYNICT